MVVHPLHTICGAFIPRRCYFGRTPILGAVGALQTEELGHSRRFAAALHFRDLIYKQYFTGLSRNPNREFKNVCQLSALRREFELEKSFSEDGLLNRTTSHSIPIGKCFAETLYLLRLHSTIRTLRPM